jgi:hypothetical protein
MPLLSNVTPGQFFWIMLCSGSRYAGLLFRAHDRPSKAKRGSTREGGSMFLSFFSSGRTRGCSINAQKIALVIG